MSDSSVDALPPADSPGDDIGLREYRLPDSKGQQQEIGIISISVFAERTAAIAQITAHTRGLATGLGEHVAAPIANTKFDKGELVAKFVIHYATAEQLFEKNIP